MNADLKAACSDHSVFVVFHCCRIGMIVFVFPLLIFVFCSCVRSCWLVISLVCWLVGLFVPVSVSRFLFLVRFLLVSFVRLHSFVRSFGLPFVFVLVRSFVRFFVCHFVPRWVVFI